MWNRWDGVHIRWGAIVWVAGGKGYLSRGDVREGSEVLLGGILIGAPMLVQLAFCH